MRTVVTNICIFLLSFSLSQGATADIDGLLEIGWAAPLYGEQVDYYLWSYTINGVEDSVSGISYEPDRFENSVQLDNLGDWALFSVRSVSISEDTSAVTVSDTVFYSLSLDIQGDQTDLLPTSFTMDVYPNPVVQLSFSMSLSINRADRYDITIFDVLGRKVKQIINKDLIVGEYVTSVENSFAPGIYFAVIANSDSHRVVKLSILGR